MALREHIEKQGQWLFRWRSYLPLLALPLCLLALKSSEYLERHFGDLADTIWEVICITISFTGLIVRSITVGYVPKGTSGRNTKEQKASTLNTTGMYSIVRNPVYLGNAIITIGMLLFFQVIWVLVVGILMFWLYYERIIFTEEEFLRRTFGSRFLSWAEKTPAFFPNFRRWKKPDLPFSFRTVLRREFSTFFAIVASFTVLDIATDIFAENELEIELRWVIFFLIGLITYLVLLFLKKKTKILRVKGR